MNINVNLLGTTEMLLNKYAVKSSKPGPRNADNPDFYKEEWVGKTYTNSKGIVVMPTLNIMACMFDGAKSVKLGKKSTTRKIYTSLQVQEFEVPVLIDGKQITIQDIKKENWLNETGAVVSGRRIDRVRTMLPSNVVVDKNGKEVWTGGWSVRFTLSLKNNELDLETIRAILDSAGKNAGLGDWRPSSPKKPGSYGTFMVGEFTPDEKE